MTHCKPEDNCNVCSERDEKLIHQLFYQQYSDQFEEDGGDMVNDRIVLYFTNSSTNQTFAVSLNDNKELVVMYSAVRLKDEE